MQKWFFNIKPSEDSTHPTRTFVVKGKDFLDAADRAKDEAQALWGVRHPWILNGGLK